MSVRVSLLAVATLALAGCNFSKAPEEQAACDCKPAAAPAAKAVATAKTADVASTETVTRVVHRKTPAVRRERSERRYYSDSSSERDYAGGAYGRRYAGVSVSVSETESSSERYRYSESEERYGSASGSAYGSSSGYASTGGGSYAQGDGRYGPPPRPRVRTYSLAGKDRDGYLTWPGKVED